MNHVKFFHLKGKFDKEKHWLSLLFSLVVIQEFLNVDGLEVFILAEEKIIN